MFVLPTEIVSNTDYKDFHGCYCFEKNYPFNPFNPCSFYQQSSFRTRIIRIFTDVIALRKLSVQSVQSVFVLPTVFCSNTDYKDFHGCYCLAVMLTWENYPLNPSIPCSKHSPVNVKKDCQKKYQPCFVPFLTVISTFSALFSKKYFLLNVIPPFHLTPIIILIISGLYMVELWWNYGWNYMKFHP